ncbi:MAG: type I restriction-modification system subunit M N-terminal domain-containing protein, partial [Candidatus Omnitrophota bacterium]
MSNHNGEKSLESWIWEAACSIRGEQDAPKYKDYILPLIFVKRLCDVFDDEVERIAEKVESKTKALKLIEKDHKIVRFYLPMRAKNVETDDTWSIIRTLTDKVGESLTTAMRQIAEHNPRIKGIIDRVDFNATTHGQRDISDEGLSRLIERISMKRLGLNNVE